MKSKPAFQKPELFQKPEMIQQWMDTNTIPRVSWWLGSEDYLKDVWFKKIEHFLLPEKGHFTGQLRNMDLDIHSIEEVIEECDTYGFFSSLKLIRVRRAEQLTTSEIEILKQSLSGFGDQCFVVFESGDLTGSEAFIRKEKELFSHIIRFEIDNTQQLKKWIQDRIKNLGFQSISNEAMAALIQAFPKNLRQLSENIEKVIAYSGESYNLFTFNPRVINAQNIEENNFKWLDNIVGGKIKECMRMTKHMLHDDKNVVFPLMGLLRWQYLSLVKASVMLKKGIPMDLICKECKIPPFKKNSIQSVLQKTSEDKWKRDYGFIAECDHKMKSSGKSQETLFLHLIWNLCQKNKELTLNY